MDAAQTAFLPALELAELIPSKQISSLELTELYIDRIERLNGRINAVVVRCFDAAREAAQAADEALASGAATGPLHDVPMTIKEQYHAAGLPTTFGNAYHDYLTIDFARLFAQELGGFVAPPGFD